MTRYFLHEGIQHLALCLILQGGKLDRRVEFNLSTSSGTAQPVIDYSDVLITDFLPTDSNKKCVNISITDDNFVEANESFTLSLTTMESAVSLSPSVATVTIIDNDKATLAMTRSHITVHESTREVDVFVELFGALEREVAILLESMDGTASFLHGDYSPFSEMLTFPQGSRTGSTVSFSVTIEDDRIVEELQYFTIHATSMDEVVKFEPQRENTTVYIEDNDGKQVFLCHFFV